MADPDLTIDPVFEGLPTDNDRPVLGGVAVERLIGEGGWGKVYLGTHIEANTNAAVRVIPSELASWRDTGTRIVRTAGDLKGLAHPNLVAILAAGIERETYYIATEFVEGGSLDARLRRDGALETAPAVRVAIDVARGLSALKDGPRIVHGDITPGSVFLTGEGGAKLADAEIKSVVFEIARVDEQLPFPIAMCPYLAPEILRSPATADHRADVYSVGAMLYHALSGSPPLRRAGRETEILGMFLGEPEPLPDSVPARIGAIVFGMLAREVGDRYGDYGEVIADLEAALADR